MKPNCFERYNQFSLKCLECKIGKLCRDKQSENRNNKLQLKEINKREIIMKETIVDKYYIIKSIINNPSFDINEKMEMIERKINE